MAELVKSDLVFILQQIQIAEANAAGQPLSTLIPNQALPYGLRTVDGSDNNLFMDQTDFGAADVIFPRLTTPVFRTAEDNPFIPGTQITSYTQTSGLVVDSQPRVISNLIVDQTANNPAAVAAAADNPSSQTVTSPGLDGIFGTADDRSVFMIPNVPPDSGLSAPFNQWMTFFGQFFDHGLDLVTKGGSGTVFMPLRDDDPLVAGADGIFGTADDLPPSLRFLALTRATNLPGPDGILGTADDIHENTNTTTPFVDQNQTYTSHPSHQVFLRAYAMVDLPGDGLGPVPVDTGKLLENHQAGLDGQFFTADDVLTGGMETWAVVKANAAHFLGIQLTDADVFDVPLLVTDPYGNFRRGPHGFAMVQMKGADGMAMTADDVFVEGDPTANGGLGIFLRDPVTGADLAVRTGHAFLNDIAFAATPSPGLLPDPDHVAGGPVAPGFYDNELLDAHYIAGDGRVNENIGLTTVHSIFHSEHNRQVDQIKKTLLADATATGSVSFLNQWLLTPVTAVPADPSTLLWNGERLFQAARFPTEMQYQHLVFEEFARTVDPNIDDFLAPVGFDATINPAIVAEFAHTVYRFGHSMLLETVDRFDPNFNIVDDPNSPGTQQLGLIAAFLNPLAYAASGLTPQQASGAIVRGVTRQVGNEIDEFVTEALRNNLLGTPQDLAAINMARGRDTGVPPLNEARREFYHMTGDNKLLLYKSWADFVQHLKHPESLINFIAAYGTHPTIRDTGPDGTLGTADDVVTLAAKRAAAAAIVLGGPDAPADSLDFLNSTGAWASTPGTDGVLGTADDVTTTGLDNVDLWVGGLAEEVEPFGGLLGSTFNFVFETQLEKLQNGDRFYYLSRTAGLSFGFELDRNSFAQMVMLNTDATHLPEKIFTTPTYILEVDQTKQFNANVIPGPDGILGTADDLPSNADPTGGITINGVEIAPLVSRDNPATPGPDTNYLQYYSQGQLIIGGGNTGQGHAVLGGTAGDDIIRSLGFSNDTIYGDGGNDRLDGGDGDDTVRGGDGDDILTDTGGIDTLDGGAGNDVIQGGNTNDPSGEFGNIITGGDGKDFIITTEDISLIDGGTGDDFILGAEVNLQMAGNEGDDWIEEGTQDGSPGDNFSPFIMDEIPGNDIFVGGPGFDEMIGEGGDDIFVASDAQDKMDGNSGFDWTTYKNDKFGVTVDMRLPIFNEPHGTPSKPGIIPQVGESPDSLLDRFAEVEGLSGSAFADFLVGDNQNANIIATITAQGSILTNIALINGLQDFLGAGVASFGSGNIILGGDGSDIIEGKGGDDLIDGDKWLNVRISVRQNADGTGPEIASFDGMKPLIPFMLNRTYNPGQLVAVREILPGNGGFDTANFQGPQANYTIAINTNGTPLNFSDDIVTVTDISAKAIDGTDRLTHIERLQFSDQAVVLVPGLNNEPVGALTITDLNGGTIRIGDTLRVSLPGVTDADNISATNPTGAVTSVSNYVWQVELAAGTGVFSDIVLAPGRIGVGFPRADGPTLTIPITTGAAELPPPAPGVLIVPPTVNLTGLRLRVRAVYEDAHGVTEQLFSAPTDPVAASTTPPPTKVIPTGDQVTASSTGVRYIRSDLDFILTQIKIAERNAAGEDLRDILQNVRVPYGLRTVEGTDNNLVNFGNANRTQNGAADTIFPRLTTPVFRPAEKVTVDLDGPGPLTVGTPTSYQQTSGFVFDSQPRTISNLIVDQTANNPAAVAAAAANAGSETVTTPGLDGIFGTADDRPVFMIPNVKPDFGLTASFNTWMTFFGQFFDHGLDLVTKGGNGTIFVPLQPDDPLFKPGSPTNFMLETRATMRPGPDGILGTADDIHENENTTTPFVDQNQTYTSHPSHQVFLRAYELRDVDPTAAVVLKPFATGKLIEHRSAGPDDILGNADDVIGGMATWAEVKAQAAKLLGVRLTDYDVSNVPLVRVDPYGNFIPGANGFAQIIVGLGADGIAQTADDVVLAGDPTANGGLGVDIPVTAPRTGHQFLIDIAHSANPFDDFGHPLTADADNIINTSPPAPGTYDDELLAAHYIAGDGRVNENIGLTAVHSIFHSEHNRLVDHTKAVVLASNDLAFLSEWLTPGTAPATFPTTQAAIDALQWNGERLFQAAKFGTEMQYQHLVFEEFARTVQPMVDPFFAPTQVYDTNINPAIVAEFAHTVYRFGHSMLTETVDRFDPAFNIVDADPLHPAQDASNHQIGLIAAFLNPLAFAASGPTPAEATGAIVRGVTREVGNEIDEFVTEALRNNLVGLPLDLAVLNLARGRDTGIPSLNAARREFYVQSGGDSQLTPYRSWADFMLHLKHPESLINFIAAYGTHGTITNATTLVDKRAAALALVLGGTGAPADRLDFLNSTGAWASTVGKDGVLGSVDDVPTTGLDDVDFWIGGLAEKQMPFGGLLGSSFNFVFENQLEKLQNGDRFYYLERTAGMNFNFELENNTFSKLVEANTDATHLPAKIFQTPNFILEVDQTKQFNEGLGSADPTGGILLTPLVIRDNPDTPGPDSNYLHFTGDFTQTVVLGGTPGDDIITAGDSDDDTVYGDAGNDRLDGGFGNDTVFGGAGDDIIADSGGDDNLQGQDGNDVMQGGDGKNLLLGGIGQDFIISGADSSELFGGPGNDFLLGNKANEFSFGNEGDDWIEAGTADGAAGDNFDPFGNDPVYGNDVLIGDGGPDNVDGEGGDDIYVATASFTDRFIGFSGFDWATFKDDPVGVTIDDTARFFDQPAVPGSNTSIVARFSLVEGFSGSAHDDVLKGDKADAAVLATAGVNGSILTNFDLINGLRALVGEAAAGPDSIVGTFDDRFDGGNIIIGGAGSDNIEGRGGDDLIDGDAWLNVRISVRATVDANNDGIADRDAHGELILGGEIASFDSMVPMISFMVNGTYDPGQLQIVREIKYSPTPDFDTAKFSGNLADYTIAINGIVVTGNAFNIGSNDIVTVTDNVAGRDGRDRLTHIERLEFNDQAVVLNGSNLGPVGKVTVLDAATNTPDNTPTQDQLLRASLAGVTDANNVSATNPTGAITGPVSYFWQQETAAGSGVFADIMFFQLGETGRADGQTFTPHDGDGLLFPSPIGLALRVRAVYEDANGVLEEVFSDPTAPVANVNDPPVITGSLISDTTPTETLAISARNAFTDLDGLPTVFNYQWQQAVAAGVGGGAAPTGFTNIVGAAAQTFTPAQAQVNRELRVVVTYTDLRGTLETVTSATTTVTGDFFAGGAGNDTFTGTEGEDIASGNAGNDVLTGLGGNDILTGGAGVDTIAGGAGDDTIAGGGGADILNGDAGNDTFTYTMGDGADTVDGGTGFDTLNITGTTGNDTLDVIYNGTALTSVEGGAVTGVEAVTANLLGQPVVGGSDVLTYAGTTANVTVNLATGTASGFTSIANIENVTGGSGNDTLTGDTNANTLNGGLGDDTFIATVGDGNDVINGGGNTAVGDTYDLSRTSAGATVTTASATSADIGTDTLGGTIENIIGSQGNDTITVNGGVNVIDGQGGDDTINAGGGNDRVSGGLGADTLIGGTGNDILNGGLGNDTFLYTIGDGADTVDGGDDLDTLTITGTAGNDTLNVVYNGTALTTVAGGTVTNVEAVTADLLGQLVGGSDTLNYAGTTANVTVNLATGTASGFTSIANIENVTGGSGNDTLTGSAGTNTLTGGAGNDTLDGNGGTDTLVGGAGDDVYITDGGDTLTEAANNGTDTVQSSVTFTLAANFENLTLTGTANLNGTGNGVANILTGNDGNNTLLGLGGNDTLIGGLGTDTLNGGANTDTLTGGLGDDTFVFATPAEAGNGATRDVITDFQGAGVAGGDVIDVNAIDANTAVAGNQNFTFIGTAAFTAPGQLRYFQDTINNLTILEGNVTGNAGAEFQIALVGLHTPIAGDFNL